MNDEMSEKEIEKDSANESESKPKKTEVDLGCVTLMIVGIIIILIGSIIGPGMIGSKRSAIENRCKLTLRALGSTMLAYTDLNDGDYGTWDELANRGFIQEGYTPESIIDYFNLIVFDVEKSVRDDDGGIIKESTFTIVAIPDNRRNRLRTFAIGDDQTPRVWVGDEKRWTTQNVDLHDIELWEPLR
ncbi:hypothetical protein KKB99_04920 [bacterium]|nr:hypothetical protein [bacterium]MBU1025339.1 hypothetical protein [bacterium]